MSGGMVHTKGPAHGRQQNMRLRSVTWSRIKGDAKAGVVIELQEGDKFEDALTLARLLVDVALGDKTPDAAIGTAAQRGHRDPDE